MATGLKRAPEGIRQRDSEIGRQKAKWKQEDQQNYQCYMKRREDPDRKSGCGSGEE